MGPWLWAAIGGAMAGFSGLAAAVYARRELHRARAESARATRRRRQGGKAIAAIVVNPTKVDMATFRDAVEEAARSFGYDRTRWYPTEPDSPGTAQALAALDAGAQVVIAAGGDGTVRAVAGALAGTRVPLGILPLGTGNLLARNLGIPLTGLTAMLRVAFGGRDRRVDVGRITAQCPDQGIVVDHEVFLVIAGLGFDAIMVSDADPALKARVGWPAYFMSGVQNLKGPRLRGSVAVDTMVRALSARSIMIGNCGRLPAGLTLLPDARIDDGLLDVAMVDTRAGLFGWASLTAQVVLQGMGVKSLPRFATGRLMHDQGRRVRVVVDRPHLVQLDGEVIGEASDLDARIEPRSLTVRVR